jgi:hypothetical protein
MSYNVAHIDVWDSNGHFHQIFQVKGVIRFNPSKSELEKARAVVEECFPNYQHAILNVMHYDKNDYNDKNKHIEL